MNCEKCKNKKATLFYADEGGKRHALCAACGASFNKLGKYEGIVSDSTSEQYLPAPSLHGYRQASRHGSIHFSAEPDNELKCPTCHTAALAAVSVGEMGCPHCYSAFSRLLPHLSCIEDDTRAAGAKMPSSHRRALDRKNKLEELRSRLRSAVAAENFELAAKLRDQIRSVEASV